MVRFNPSSLCRRDVEPDDSVDWEEAFFIKGLALFGLVLCTHMNVLFHQA
jgi:hypothetical protein